MRSTALALLPLLALASPAPAEITKTIPNPLKDSWPLELISFDVPAADAPPPMTCTIQGKTRPTQMEPVDGGKTMRIWTLATIDPKASEGTTNIPAVLAPGDAPSPLSVREEGDHYIVSNGVYDFKVRRYAGKLPKPTKLEDLPHWIGGMRVAGESAWDGRARFEGPALVDSATTEIVARGPVFVDFKITITADTPTGKNVEAVPIQPGKQSFRFGPNKIAQETIPAYDNRYEVMVRFVAEDPWIDVAQRAYFPRDPNIKPWGFNQEMVEFGGGSGMPIDTAMWVRWFEWDKFGGNVELLFAPAAMREAQKGRPFAMLRPIWNQGPGGSQDFFLTSTGATPTEKTPNPSYNPKAPAVGVVAAFPSKWVGPFAQTIVCRAENGNSGSWRLPLVPAEDANPPKFHYGQRSFGICVGPRELFDTTGKMNGIVRRHTDWTLNALINKYILEWARDPSKAGPSIIVNRESIEELRKDFAAGKHTPVLDAIREEKPEVEGAAAKITELTAKIDEAKNRLQGAGSDANRDSIQEEIQGLQKQLDDAKKIQNSADADLVRLVTGGDPVEPRLPTCDLWRTRRYQDDFLNPTSGPVRRWVDVRRADLMAGGKPLGGAEQAAMAYIVTDPDSWMGWRQGWMPGNPNFHTDKYLAAFYLGAAMRDHPHSADWITFAEENFQEDLKLVLFPPDGVGVECPGYSGYAMDLILNMAAGFQNIGEGNMVADNPLFRGTGTWHRKLLTPVDPRLGFRHEAPIGDTHRWTSGLGEYFGDLGKFFREKDPRFAAEMMSVWRELERSGYKSKRSPLQRQLAMDYSLPEIPLKEMDWSSQSFHGFGAVLRTNFGTPRETFLSYKAGPIRGHYHNDENSFHYYALNEPVALDYNCSYHPRGDHAALHNSMTFGEQKKIMNNAQNREVLAQEQIMEDAVFGNLTVNPAGDLIVSERKAKNLQTSPVFPDDAEFQREYPRRQVGEIVHRRLLLLVKHPEGSKMSDYLVVRDETVSPVDQQMNLHLFARDAKVSGNRIDADGQLGVDMAVFLAPTPGAQPSITLSSWHYHDEFLVAPEDYAIKAGESLVDWDSRMERLAKSSGASSLPLPGFKPKYLPRAPDEKTDPWAAQIESTGGLALVPPKIWKGPWQFGEYQKWIRVNTPGGKPLLWVLYPYKKGESAPKITASDDKTVTVSVGGETDEITMDSAGGVRVKNGSGTQEILPAGSLPPLGELKPLAQSK